MPKSIFQHPEIKRLLKKFNLNENEFKNDFDLLEQVRDDFDNKSKKWIRSFIVDEDNKIKPTLRMSDNFLIKEKLRKNNLTATFFIKNFESEVDFEHPIKDAFERFLKNPEKFKRGYYLVSEKNETDVNQYLLYLAKNAMLADLHDALPI